MISGFFRARKRQQYLAATESAVMRCYLEASLPHRNDWLQEVEFLAVDLEMDGLNADTNQILSIGYVPIINNQVVIKDARHHVVKAGNVDLHETAPIHQLRDIDLEGGQSLESAINELLQALAGRVLILHHAPLDTSFLNKACRQLYGVGFLAPTMDTMAIERKRLQRLDHNSEHSVRLNDCRRRYNLPAYKGHNAAIDALATAELWLAQQEHITTGKTTKLSYFLNSI